MSETNYKNHPLRSAVNHILDLAANEAMSDPSVADNEQYTFARDKVFAIARLINSKLEKTPAILVSQAGLNNVSANMQSVVNDLNNFIANKNPGHLVNAANMLDQNILPVLWVFAYHENTSDLSSIASIVEDLRKSALQSIEALAAQRADLGDKIQKLEQEIQFQINKLSDLSEAVAAQKAEALAVTAQVQREYADTEAARSASFNEKIKEFEGEFEEYDNDVRNEATELLSMLQQSKHEAATIVAVVGNTGLTGNYQKIANNETQSANIWRRITIGLFVVGIVVAGATFIKFLIEPFTPESAWSALIRLLYAVAITSPAWYAAKESARHRTNAESARKIELELASLGPFIELMPEEKSMQLEKS